MPEKYNPVVISKIGETILETVKGINNFEMGKYENVLNYGQKTKTEIQL